MYLRGVDHALQAIGRPLQCFLPARRPLPLTATQVRYYTVLQGRPAGESLPAGVERKRSCILEKDTGKRWLEMPDMPGGRPAFFAWSDQGAIGWYSWFACFLHLGIRGCNWFDPFHRNWRDAQAALKAAGLWILVLESTVVMNMFSGPWQGDAYFSSLSDAADEWRHSSSAEDPLFKLLYEGIAMDGDEMSSLPPDFGDEEHSNMMFESVAAAECFHTKPAKVKLALWFSWLDGACNLVRIWHRLLLVLIYMCVRHGIYEDLSDVQFFPQPPRKLARRSWAGSPRRMLRRPRRRSRDRRL